jgi:hypothetical protein
MATNLESIDVVREDDDLVATVLMEVDEVLTRLELGRVHAVEEELLPSGLVQVLLVELGRHRAPDFSALARRPKEKEGNTSALG